MNVLLIQNGEIKNRISAESVARAESFFPGYLCVEDTPENVALYSDAGEPAPPAPITKLEFLRRFTTAQRIAIRMAAESDPILKDAMQLLDLAQDVRVDDPDTAALVGYLTQLGLVSVEDAQHILS